MSGAEIKRRIEYNNKQLEILTETTPMNFVLNPEIAALIQENKMLQGICQHSFKNGVCEYCGMEEEHDD